MKISALSLLSLVLIFFSSALSAETPNKAASEIHSLLASKDYDTLFKTRYSEWYKAKKENMKEEDAIKMLSQRFEKQHSILLSVYEQLKTAKFTISERENPQQSENGKVAQAMVTVNSKKLPFKLYQMKDDKWGFHL